MLSSSVLLGSAPPNESLGHGGATNQNENMANSFDDSTSRFKELDDYGNYDHQGDIEFSSDFYLERITIRGFKSFREEQVVYLHKGINVIVGLNGSGKSNLLKAIGFAIGHNNNDDDDNFFPSSGYSYDISSFREEKDLSSSRNVFHNSFGLYGEREAVVELVFNNTSRKLPLSTDKVILKRVSRNTTRDTAENDITTRKDNNYSNNKNSLVVSHGMKDSYYLNNLMIKKEDVGNFLQAGGFVLNSSKNSFEQTTMIQQTTMIKQSFLPLLAEMLPKSDYFLEIIRELSGINVFERNSLEIKNELRKLDENKIYIAEKIYELKKKIFNLENDEKELKYVKKLEIQEKKILKKKEYEKESKITNQINKIEKKIMEIEGLLVENVKEKNNALLVENVKEKNNVLLVENVEEKNNVLLVENVEEKNNVLLPGGEENLKSLIQFQELLDDKKQKLERKKKSLLEMREEVFRKIVLDKQRKEIEQNAELREEKDTRLQQAIGLDMDDGFEPAFGVEMEIIDSRIDGRIDSRDNQEIAEEQPPSPAVGRSSLPLSKPMELNNPFSENRPPQPDPGIPDFSIRKFDLTREKNLLRRDLENLAREMSQCSAQMRNGVQNSIYRGIEKVMEVKKAMEAHSTSGSASGPCTIYGPLLHLFTARPEYHTAIEVAFGSSLWNILCRDDEVASELLTKCRTEKWGKLECIAFNRVNKNLGSSGVKNPIGKNAEWFPLLDILELESEEFKPVFHQVCHSWAICKDLETCGKVSKQFGFNCVTLEGDREMKSGIITGGKPPKTIVLETEKWRRKIELKKSRLERELKNIDIKLKELDREKVSSIPNLVNLLPTPSRKSVSSEKKGNVVNDKKGSVGVNSALERKHEVNSVLQRKNEGHDANIEDPFLEDPLLGSGELIKPVDDTAFLATLESDIATLETDLRDLESKEDLNKRKIDTLKRRKGKLIAERTQLRRECEQAKHAARRGFGGSLGGSLGLGGGQEYLKNFEKEFENVENDVKELIKKEMKEMEDDLSEKGEDRKQEEEIDKKQKDDLTIKLDRKRLPKTLPEIRLELEKYANVNRRATEQLSKLSKDVKEVIVESEVLDKTFSKLYEYLDKVSNNQTTVLEHMIKEINVNFQEFFQVVTRRRGKSRITPIIEDGEGLLDCDEEVLLVDDLLVSSEEEDDLLADNADNKNHVSKKKTHYPRSDIKDAILDDKKPKRKPKRKLETIGTKEIVGVKIEVCFSIKNSNKDSHEYEYQPLHMLSGGQRSVVALCLIFALQKLSPAPLYTMDEPDSNLDSTFSGIVSQMVQSRFQETQLIVTTFRPELVNVADRIIEVHLENKASCINTIDAPRAKEILLIKKTSS